MSREVCPYCGCDSFVSDKTKQFSDETISEANSQFRYWINQCVECSCFSINDSKNKQQLQLKNPNDANSEWLAQ